MLYVKCQEIDCPQVATWKAGTWWFCDEHVKQYLYPVISMATLTPEEFLSGKDFVYPERSRLLLESTFGTASRHGPCLAEEYWSSDPPKEMTVE